MINVNRTGNSLRIRQLGRHKRFFIDFDTSRRKILARKKGFSVGRITDPKLDSSKSTDSSLQFLE